MSDQNDGGNGRLNCESTGSASLMQVVIIIGAGHAGIQAATSLRAEGYSGKITMISSEEAYPYQKPPLSKGFLKGELAEANLAFRSNDFFEKNEIELLLGTSIIRIDRENKQVTSDSDQQLSYDYLILAAGANNRKLNIPGSEEVKLFDLRTLSDAKEIQEKLDSSQDVVIIGGGFIGLEIAAAAIKMGKRIHVIENQSRVMARVLPPIITDIFQQVHMENGVSFLLNALVDGFARKDNSKVEVRYNISKSVVADMVIVGIGVIPSISLATQCGIACENGITVDKFMQTSDPNIFAIGDCANHYNPYANKRLRLESVQNAVDQAKVAAKSIVGKKEEYNEVPWFWTNQYQLKLQMAGINEGYDDYVVRGSIDDRKCSFYYYKAGKLIGVDSLNKPSDHLTARKLLRAKISPSKEEVLDLTTKLKQLLA